MLNRSLKRLIIFVVLLSFMAAGAFFYFQGRSKTETCFDNIRNQNEADVDCGGVCSSCQGRPEDFIIEPPILIPAENNRYDAAFKIINPNTNFGASNIDYTIEVFAADGTRLATRKDSTFIMPTTAAEKEFSNKWVIEHGLKGEAEARVELSLDNITWQGIQDNFEMPRLLILDRVYNVLKNSPEFAEAKGVLKNDSAYNFDNIEIQVLLFNEQNKLVATRRTEARTMRSGERREFRVSWRVPIENVVKIEMFAHTNVFLNDNFVNNYNLKEKFQEIR